MAKFTYKERLTVSVHEMTRAQALRFAQTVNAVLELQATSDGVISSEVNVGYALNSPCHVSYEGKLLENGMHNLALDGEMINLTLPLTRECFDNLPVSLTALWIEAAQVENEWLSNRFLAVLNQILPLTSEPKSDSEPLPA